MKQKRQSNGDGIKIEYDHDEGTWHVLVWVMGQWTVVSIQCHKEEAEQTVVDLSRWRRGDFGRAGLEAAAQWHDEQAERCMVATKSSGAAGLVDKARDHRHCAAIIRKLEPSK